jgi:hemin uptake protein HemP
MDLPITRPSKICYADECDFPEMLIELSANKHNGFIRITSGDDEGFILFKKGNEIAASYDRYSRVEAIENIKVAMEDGSTIIEVFEVRESQVDFFMDMNKPYIIGSEAYQIIDELKNRGQIQEEPKPQLKAVPKPKPVSEAINKSESVDEPKLESNLVKAPEVNTVKDTITEKTETAESDTLIKPQTEIIESDTLIKPQTEIIESDTLIKPQTEDNTSEEINNEIEKSSENLPSNEDIANPNETSLESPIKHVPTESKVESETTSSIDSNIESDVSVDSDVKSDSSQADEKNENLEMPAVETEPIDRMELMKKYGIKDIQEEDVENILDSYKGGSVSDEDIEKIELTLMNKIKKSLLGISKIKGAEVMVFLENSKGLTGNVNIIIETESKGFLSRIRGDSTDEKLEKQITDISQIEIKKSFRKYPEIIDKFDVNVEIS